MNESYEHLPSDTNLDGTDLTITPHEHGRFCEPHVLMVKDRDGKKWPYIPMTINEKRSVDLRNTADQLVRDFKEMHGDDIFSCDHPTFHSFNRPDHWDEMNALNDVLAGGAFL